MTIPQPSNTHPHNDHLKTTEYVGYALGDTASNFFFQTFNIFLTYYYVDVWGIAATSLLWMFPIVRLFDALNDPLMGLIADRTRSRWGRFRPYLLWGAIPYGICGFLLFAGPNFGPTGKLVYAYITYTAMLVSYTVINVPYSSLLGVISPSSRTRAVASSFRFVGAFSGMLLISLFVRPFVNFLGRSNHSPNVDYILGFRSTMAIFAVISVIMFWITFATTKERVTPPANQQSNAREELLELLHNWPWVMLLFASILSTAFSALRSGSTIFFFENVVGNDKSPLFSIASLGLNFDRTTVFLTTGAIGLVIGTATLGSFVRRIDKKYCAAALSAVTGLCFAAFFFLPPHWYATMLILNTIAQFCAGPTSALTWALYGDVADYGEWRFGRRSTGLVYSASLFAIKTGMVVGGFLLPLFLHCFGYAKGAKPTPFALLGITLAFSIVPGSIALLKALALLIYPLDQKRVDQIELDLANRRQSSNNTPVPA